MKGVAFKIYAIFIPFSKLCLALGLSVFCENYVGHWVCLFFVRIMLGIGFVYLFLGWLGHLCLALPLSVICGNYVGHCIGFVCLLVG